MDPCLDDCVMMAKRLKSLGIPIGLDVLPGLPHGFLSFVKVNKYSNSKRKSFKTVKTSDFTSFPTAFQRSI